MSAQHPALRFGLLFIGLTASAAIGQSENTPHSRRQNTVDRIEFNSTPVLAVAGYLEMVLRKPVLVGWEANCKVTFVAKDLSFDDILPCISAAIESNGFHVVKNTSWIKIVPRTQPEPLPDTPHVEVRITEDQLTVGGAAVSLEKLAEHINTLSSDTELWIVDLTYPPARTATSIRPEMVVAALGTFDRKRIFRMNPTTITNRPVVAEAVISGTPNLRCTLRTVDRLGQPSALTTELGREPARHRQQADYVSCELQRVSGTGSLTVELYSKTNLVISGTLPDGKWLLRLQKGISGWIREEY